MSVYGFELRQFAHRCKGIAACWLILSVAPLQTVSATVISGEVTGGGATNFGATFIKLTVPFTESDPDNTVGDDTFQNPNLYAFDEDQNILLTADLLVDDLADGAGGGSGAGSIFAGTVVASHYIFFDPQGNRTQIGNVSFDSNVLGVISSTDNLAASDFLINTGVTYLNPTLRGLEDDGTDTVTITGLQTITVDWYAGTPGDYIRVITELSPAAVVPVPTAVWLFASALMVLVRVRSKISA